MSSLFAMRVLLIAGEGFAAATLVMALAWLGASQKTASRRHLVWCAGFGALLLLPVLVGLLPSLVQVPVEAERVAIPQPMDLAVAMNAPATGFSLDPAMLADGLLKLWFAGVLLVVTRALFGAFALYRLRAKSVVHRFGHLPISGPRCELRLSIVEDDRGPVTWGLWRPIILLPKDAVEWPRERLDLVLQHELAHVARRDCLAQMVALTVCALYWPNPFVWLGARAMRRQAEMAADDAVLLSGVRPSAYAGELLQIAQRFNGQSLSATQLAMAAPSALEARVKAVLAPAQARAAVTAKDVGRIAGLGFAAAMALAFVRPSLAEATPRAVAAVPALPAVPARDPLPNVATAMPVEDTEMAMVDEPDAAPPDDADVSGASENDANEAVHAYSAVERRDEEVRVIHRRLTMEERQRIHQAVREAQAAVVAAQPEIARAVREAVPVREIVAAIEAQKVQLATQVAQAHQAEAEQVRLAHAQAQQVRAQVRQALAAAHAAIAKAREEAASDEARDALDEAEANLETDVEADATETD